GPGRNRPGQRRDWQQSGRVSGPAGGGPLPLPPIETARKYNAAGAVPTNEPTNAGVGARLPLTDCAAPDRCRIAPEEGPICQQADGQMWQECGRPRHETGNQSPITDPMIYRARRCRAWKSAPRGRTPGGIFHLHERGAGWSRTGPAHVPFPKSSIGEPTPIFWPNFLGKNFGNKNRVVSIPGARVLRVGRSDSARSDSGPGTVGHY